MVFDFSPLTSAFRTSSVKFELQQTTLNRPVVENDAARRFEADAFGQRQVAGQDPGGPTCPALLERVADLAVEILKAAFVAYALAVGRIADQCAPPGRRIEPGEIML